LVHPDSVRTLDVQAGGQKMKNPKPIRKKKPRGKVSAPRPIRKGKNRSANKPHVSKIGVDEADLMELQALLLPMLEPLAVAGSWVIALFSPNGTQVNLQWNVQDFPTNDFETCVKLLKEELDKQRNKTLGEALNQDEA